MSDLTSKHKETAVPLDKNEEILKAANVLFEPGQLVEVRLKKRDGRIASRYFKDHEKMAVGLAKEDASEKWAAAWWTLQQLKPGAHAGKQARGATKRGDIEAYRWLVPDAVLVVQGPAGGEIMSRGSCGCGAGESRGALSQTRRSGITRGQYSRRHDVVLRRRVANAKR